jgi:hypothetical protein
VATDAQLTLAIIARDKATADLKKVESQLARLQKRHTSFASTAAKSLAVGAVVAYGAASVKAFADAEKSQARLELAYKKFPALAGTSIDSLRALNSEMQAKVGVDDDALAAAQATLAQFKLTGEQIRQLTPLLVDYATVTGQDVTTAAGSLGKAFMGNAKALKAIGINFKATGDTARDFDTVMAALEQKVGGAGEAFGKTTANRDPGCAVRRPAGDGRRGAGACTAGPGVGGHAGGEGRWCDPRAGAHGRPGCGGRRRRVPAAVHADRVRARQPAGLRHDGPSGGVRREGARRGGRCDHRRVRAW